MVTFRAMGLQVHKHEWYGKTVQLDAKAARQALRFIGLGDRVQGVLSAADFDARLRRALWPSRCAGEDLSARLSQLLDLVHRVHRAGYVMLDWGKAPPPAA